MANRRQITPPPFADTGDVAELYADGVAGVTFTNGNLKLTFTTVRADHSKEPATHNRTVSARLVLPVATVLELQTVLANMMKELEGIGVVEAQPPGPVTIQ